jgi:hypothetical protein
MRIVFVLEPPISRDQKIKIFIRRICLNIILILFSIVQQFRTRNVRSTSPHVALSVSSLNYCFELLGIATYRE